MLPTSLPSTNPVPKLSIPEGCIVAQGLTTDILDPLQTLFSRLVAETPPQFEAGKLDQAQLERTLGQKLEFPVPLRLQDVMDNTDPSAFPEQQLQTSTKPRPFDEFALAEFTKHCESRALRPVPFDDPLPTLCLPLFAVQQESKNRLIFDARVLNASLSNPSFEMETVFDVPALAEGMTLIGKLDLTQAYCQYPVAADLSSRLGCFGPDGSTFRWHVLPFGLSHSPRVFCSLTSSFVRKWRKCGIRCMAYVDDIIFFAASPAEFVSNARTILSDLRAAGVWVAPHKTFILPFTRLDVLGLRVDMTTQSFSVPPSKIRKIADAARVMLAEGACTRQALLSLVGRLGYASVACPYVIFFRAALLGCIGSNAQPFEKLFFTTQAMVELSFWSSDDAATMLASEWPWKRFCTQRIFAKHSSPRAPPDFTVWGDASEFGAGFNSSATIGLPQSEPLPPEFAGNEVPSIVRELYVIVRLAELSQVPRGSCLRLVSDNMGAVATANGSAVCASTAPLARRLVRALMARDVTLQVEWAPRELLDDVDQRSRWDANDLSHAMCTDADYANMFSWAFGPDKFPDVQLFSCASSAIESVPQCTRFPEPASRGCPFLLPWPQAGNIWAFPPFRLARPFLLRLLSMCHEPISMCALLPCNAAVEAAISALPAGWRSCKGPSTILAPPTYSAHITCPFKLILVASPIR
jgi:hypothetical protein